MAVVINEFEVVAEAPPPATTAQGTEATPPAQPTPRDVERMMRHRIERALRVLAH
jgi:hypothetical protein